MDNEYEEIARKEREFMKKMTESQQEQFAQMPYFPASVYTENEYSSVQIDVGTAAFFADEMAKFNLYGNGHCWADIVTQLVKRKNPQLMSNLNFSPEADTCFIACTNAKSAKTLGALIHQYLGTRDKFVTFLNTIDTSTLDC